MSHRWLVVVVAVLSACNISVVAFTKAAQDADQAPPPQQPPPQQLNSCLTLPATCGPAGANDSCCTSPLVSGGSFDRSYDVASDNAYPSNAYVATVSDFRLDKYEVTVGRFRAFVNAGKGTTATAPAANAGARVKIAGSGWDATWNTSLAADTLTLKTDVKCQQMLQTWTDNAGANENRPMNCITWLEAMAFCIWDGGFLPTEAEWNYAATGGDQQRAYPWSDPPGTLTTLDDSHASYNCVSHGVCDVTDLAPVGTKPAGDGRWGQSDLAGNLAEWTIDWDASTYLLPCTDCANVVQDSASARVFRGGSFGNPAATLRAGNREFGSPTTRPVFVGVRCARTP